MKIDKRIRGSFTTYTKYKKGEALCLNCFGTSGPFKEFKLSRLIVCKECCVSYTSDPLRIKYKHPVKSR